MTTAVFALLIGTLNYVGDLEQAYRSIAEIKPSLITPWTWSPVYQMSMWVVFGLVYIGQPHGGAMGALMYRDTKAMHKAIRLGIFFVVVWTLILPFLGNLTFAIYPDLKVPDQAIPILTMTVLPPWLAGLTLAGGCWSHTIHSRCYGNSYKLNLCKGCLSNIYKPKSR